MAALAQRQTARIHGCDLGRRGRADRLVEYIAIPAKSPSFEPEWQKLRHGSRRRALRKWAETKLAALNATMSVERSAWAGRR